MIGTIRFFSNYAPFALKKSLFNNWMIMPFQRARHNDGFESFQKCATFAVASKIDDRRNGYETENGESGW